MKRSITQACLLISLAALLVVSAMTLNMAYRSNVGSQTSRLQQLAYAMRYAGGKSYGSLARALASKSGSPAVRVTFYSSSGVVLGDSGGLSPGRKILYPEVTEAQNAGYADHFSGGFTRCVFSCALALSDGNLLRLSTTADCLSPVLPLTLFPFLLGLFLVLVLLPAAWSVVLGQICAAGQSVLDCLHSALRGRRKPLSTEEDELKPLTHGINDALEQFLAQLGQAESRRQSIESILGSMKEGLIVLDSSLSIVTINASAAEVFRAPANIGGHNLLRLTHHAPILDAAGSAARDGVRMSVDYTPPQDPTRIFQIFASPLRRSGAAPGGAILLLSDVTNVRKTEKIRSDFVANASHELKTPLTAIRGFAELIESQTVTDPEQIRRYLSLIRQESDRLILLIGDVLRLSELEGKALDSGISAVSLKLIAQKAALSLREQAEKKSVQLRVEGDDGMFRANPDRMTQLFLNLMENAVKYNKTGGTVDVVVKDGDDFVRFDVRDTGVGISPEDRERVFERFFRVEQSHNRKIPGTGLGLAIVKHIVELYGGGIDLQSEPGRGTVITVTFPLRPAGEPG